MTSHCLPHSVTFVRRKSSSEQRVRVNAIATHLASMRERSVGQFQFDGALSGAGVIKSK